MESNEIIEVTLTTADGDVNLNPAIGFVTIIDDDRKLDLLSIITHTIYITLHRLMAHLTYGQWTFVAESITVSFLHSSASTKLQVLCR